MKATSILLGLIIGIITFTIAQKADSIVVTYDNQYTTIPVPAFGKQITIKIADSIQIIEFGVSRRKTNDSSWQQPYSSNIHKREKSATKTKWFSQIEVGFISEFVSDKWFKDYNEYQDYTVFYINQKNMNGYKIALSINEKEKQVSKKYSYVSGFKIGFAQSFRKSAPQPVPEDTLIHHYYGYNSFTNSSIKFLIPVGFRYSFISAKSSARINFGANLGASMEFKGDQTYESFGKYTGMAILIEPYLGMEIGKIGLLASANISLLASQFYLPNYSFFDRNFVAYYGLGISLTYRLF